MNLIDAKEKVNCKLVPTKERCATTQYSYRSVRMLFEVKETNGLI